LFSFATFFAFSFKRLSREGIVNDMNFKVQIFIITVKYSQEIDDIRYNLSVLASPFLEGAAVAPALVRVTPCPFSLFVAAPCPL
jgi:hypothetical protein